MTRSKRRARQTRSRTGVIAWGTTAIGWRVATEGFGPAQAHVSAS